MNKRTEANLSNLLLVILAIVMVSIIAIISFKVGTLSNTDNQDQICVPKIAGVYTPIDGSSSGIVVLDLNNSVHKQFFSDIQKAWLSINQGGLK